MRFEKVFRVIIRIRARVLVTIRCCAHGSPSLSLHTNVPICRGIINSWLVRPRASIFFPLSRCRSFGLWCSPHRRCNWNVIVFTVVLLNPPLSLCYATQQKGERQNDEGTKEIRRKKRRKKKEETRKKREETTKIKDERRNKHLPAAGFLTLLALVKAAAMGMLSALLSVKAQKNN